MHSAGAMTEISPVTWNLPLSADDTRTKFAIWHNLSDTNLF
jgi:hypothetical protein